jgi:hypothetical protein
LVHGLAATTLEDGLATFLFVHGIARADEDGLATFFFVHGLLAADVVFDDGLPIATADEDGPTVAAVFFGHGLLAADAVLDDGLFFCIKLIGIDIIFCIKMIGIREAIFFVPYREL